MNNNTNNTNNNRRVYNVSKHGPYKRDRKLARIGMGIRRGDTRHGGFSGLILWQSKNKTGRSRSFVLTLAEARALKSFLERELKTLAR
jgi:hypothetical protein